MGQDAVGEELFSRRHKIHSVQAQDQKHEVLWWMRRMLIAKVFLYFEDGVMSSCGGKIAKVMCVVILEARETG